MFTALDHTTLPSWILLSFFFNKLCSHSTPKYRLVFKRQNLVTSAVVVSACVIINVEDEDGFYKSVIASEVVYFSHR